MKMCEAHWAQLRGDVSKYGLSHLIAPDGAAAKDMLVRQLEGKAGELDFDPLMNANNMLWSMAMDVVGLRMLATKPDGAEPCPACELRDYNWVEGAAYQSRVHAEKNGLLLEPPTEETKS